MTKKYIDFDPRSKLATVFFASFLLMWRVNGIVEGVFVTVMLLLLILNGGRKKGLICYSFYWLLYLLDKAFFTEITGALSSFIAFLLVGNKLMLPPVMAGIFAANRTKVSEWVAALKKWRVPDTIIIPFIVVCRFFPTLIQDFKRIRNAMKFRGIAVSTTDMLLHPFKTLEYVIVPMLMTVENTSLDLSAAALVRGLGNPGMHTSVYEVKLKIQDYVLLSLLLSSFIVGVISR